MSRVRWLVLRACVRLYPRRWRERYGDEVLALADDAGTGIGDVADLVLGGLRQRAHELIGVYEMSSRARYWVMVCGGALAILVVMPTAVFIGLALFYPGVQYMGVEWPLGIQVAPHLDWLIPVLPALGLLIAVSPVVRVSVRRDASDGSLIRARILHVPRALLLVIALCASLLGIVIGYGISENLLEAMR